MQYPLSNIVILSHMSGLSLRKRLLPAKKAWKTFTTKLQINLKKLQRSKAIKKPRNKLHNTPTKVLRPPLSLYFPLQRKRRLIKPSLTLHPRYYQRYLLQKRPSSPVYIDDLFKQPDSEVATTTAAKKSEATDHKGRNMAAGTSGKGSEKRCTADDMWESVELASPQMHGIDERADDFIARFRAEMELQEMMARDL